MALNAIDLSKLPPPSVVEELDFETILAQMTADLLARAEALDEQLAASIAVTLAQESEPLVKLLEVCAYREMNLRARVNQAARQTMLAFAVEANLDAAAANLAVEREAGERDDDLRDRAALAPESWSVAGPTGAYLYFAKSASPLVADVDADSPTPGRVVVTVLSTADDGVADDELLTLVDQALSGDMVRPFCEDVVVVSATIEAYDVMATLFLADGPDASTVVAAAEAAVRAYAASRRKIRKGVALAGLQAALMQPGVENVLFDAPSWDVDAAEGTAPVLRDLIITTEVGGSGV